MDNGSSCKFCMPGNSVHYESKWALAILDRYPVTDLHTLIIPKRHVKSYFDLTAEEQIDCMELLITVKLLLNKLDKKITAFNVGINDGVDAGQTVSHCHIHLIPRRKNDASNPIGGVRKVIPEKAEYLKNELVHSEL